MSCTGSTVNRVGGCNCTPSSDPCSACCGKSFELTGTVNGETVTWDDTNGWWISDWIAFMTTIADPTTCVTSSGDGYYRYTVYCDGSSLRVVMTIPAVYCSAAGGYFPISYADPTLYTALGFNDAASPSSCDPLTASVPNTSYSSFLALWGSFPATSYSVSIGQVGAGGECYIDCDPCPIPAIDLNILAYGDGFSPGGGGLSGTMTYTDTPDLWESECLNISTSYIRPTLECNAGNTLFTVALSSSTSACDVTPTDYTIEYGTTSTDLIKGEWESITTQNWDSVTAPSTAVSGWNVDATIDTSTTNDVSSPNSLTLPTSSTDTFYYATYATSDGHSGNVKATGRVLLTETGRDSSFGLMLRGSDSSLSSSDTFYCGEVKDVEFSTGGSEYRIYKRVSGTVTALDTVNSAEIIDSLDLKVIFSAINDQLALIVQRMSDNKYMNSSGSWVTGRAAVCTVTDGSITGAGYSGVNFWEQSTITSPPYHDDFELDGIVDNGSCTPFTVDYTVMPGNGLWAAGFDGFSISE